MRGRAQTRVRDESGFALVLALAVILALGTAVTSVAYYSTSNFHDSARSRSDQNALALAEAGLNLAYSTLEHASNPSMASAVSSVPVADVAMQGGFVTYYGSYDATNQIWTLTGLGKAYDTGHPGSFIVRAAHGRAHVGTESVGDSNNAVWNYVYADSTATCTSIGNSVNVNVPFYVKGNLCMSNTARVTSYALQVGGKVTMSSPSNEIGDPSAYLHEAHIGGGCSIDGGVHYFTPCSTATKVYATTTDASPTVLTKPPVDLSGTAASANLGPMHGCDVGSVPWGGFDNNTNHLDQSLGTINLVPATHYDCKALDASGNVVGEIGWDGTTLTIAGTIFLDGNIAFGQQNVVVYKGKATIYASGSISIAQKSTICGTAACDTTWDTSKNLLAWVAGKSCPAGSGTTESDSFSIANNSIFQGAIYAVCDYGEGNSTTVWGPIIAHQLYMQNSTVNYYVPIGTLLPGMPAQYDQVQTIVPDPGSWSS